MAVFTLLSVRFPVYEAPSIALYARTDDGVPFSSTWFAPPQITVLTTSAAGEFSKYSDVPSPADEELFTMVEFTIFGAAESDATVPPMRVGDPELLPLKREFSMRGDDPASV
jgi:hypothetical protein